MALCAFRDADVDYAVLETGLGGRLDATSAVEPPEVCVITSIGYDHMQYLGDTLEEIAAEKAGIIRPGVPVFYAASSEESDSVIRKAAQNNGCFCKKSGKTRTKSSEPGINILHFPVPVIIMEIPRGN